MFLRLLLTSILLQLVARAAVTNSSKGQTADALTLPKQASAYDDYDLNDQKLVGAHVEGSGGAASLDEYADDEEEEQLSKITATTVNSSMSTGKTSAFTTTTTTATRTTTTMKTSTTITTTTMMTKRTSTSTTMTTTVPSSKWMKSTSTYDQPKRKNENSTISSTFNDLDVNEFKDDHEEYADDLEDDAYYNEPTVSNRVPMGSPPPTRYPSPSTRAPISTNHTTPIWILFSFLTRPPIAAGILAGKFHSDTLLSQRPVLFPQVWPSVFSPQLFFSSVLFGAITNVKNLIHPTRQAYSIPINMATRNHRRNSMLNHDTSSTSISFT